MTNFSSEQSSLFDVPEPKPKETILGNQHHEAVDPGIDVPRLMYQYGRVVDVLLDQQWHTLAEIAEKTGAPHGSAGSQVRNARVDGYVVEKRRVAEGSGLWEYRYTGVRTDQRRQT